MPDHTDPFVAKIRQATKNVGEAFVAVSDVHNKAIEEQLTVMLQARSGGSNPKNSLEDYMHKSIIEAEQRAALANVEAACHDLEALREELPVQHNLSKAENDTILDRIELDLSKCAAEKALLMSAASLSHLDDDFVNVLLDVHGRGQLDQSSWQNGRSPMHMATEHNRRDVIEYLLNLPGGYELLEMRDSSGNTPVFHARSKGHSALEHWLQQETNNTGVLQPRASSVGIHRGSLVRPNISAIPPQYMKLLQQIETTGWVSVSWKNGYTMLHWAASKGHADLCGYLVKLNADLELQDKNNRTPLDIARNAGHSNVVVELENLQSSLLTTKRSSVSPARASFQGASGPRTSVHSSF